MDDVESVAALQAADAVQPFATDVQFASQWERERPAKHGSRARVSGCEQRHLVSGGDQRFS
jgi:hypothetical protein